MGNPKDKEHSNAEATGKAGESATRETCNACQVNRDLSHESRERAAAMDKLVVEAIEGSLPG